MVGSQARILYSDQKGRVAIAVAFNQAIARGELKVGAPPGQPSGPGSAVGPAVRLGSQGQEPLEPCA